MEMCGIRDDVIAFTIIYIIYYRIYLEPLAHIFLFNLSLNMFSKFKLYCCVFDNFQTICTISKELALIHNIYYVIHIYCWLKLFKVCDNSYVSFTSFPYFICPEYELPKILNKKSQFLIRMNYSYFGHCNSIDNG